MALSQEALTRLTSVLGGAGVETEIAALLATLTLYNGSNAVKVSAGDVVMAAAQQVQVVNKTSGAATAVTLPASPATWAVAVVKDGKGDAATNNITVAGAAGNIDGAASHVINTNYGCGFYVYNGTQWNEIASNVVSLAGAAVVASLTSAGAISGTTLSMSGATIKLGSTAAPAAAGADNTDGVVIAAASNYVTGANGTKGCVLPAAPVVGQKVVIVNTVSGQTLKVYADASGTGGTINGGSANAAYSLTSLKAATFECISITGANQWWSLSN